MNKYLVIINPKAGKGRGLKASPAIKDFLNSRNLDHHIEFSKAPGHITKIVKDLSAGFTHLVAVGGDGTLNEMVNGFDLNAEKVLGVLPIGSGNDFARNLNLSKNLSANLEYIFSPAPALRNFDIGEIFFEEQSEREGRRHRFINSVGVGFDALVADLHQNSRFFSGIASYVAAVFKALIKYRLMQIRIHVDEKIIEGQKLLVCVGNGITSGGGFYLTPKAVIDDKKLDICIIDRVSRLKLVKSLPKALINKLDSVPEALMLLFNELKITLEEPYIAHADGEIISRNIKELTINLLPNKIKVITNKS